MSAAENTATETTAQNDPPVGLDAGRDLAQAKLILEAALLSSSEPLQLIDLKKLFDQELSSEVIRKLLEELKTDWSSRAVELTPVASGWRFRVKPEFAQFVQRMNPEKPPRYSRAVLETLAIIAYKQPATRGDIEQIRGVQVSPQIIKTLEERGWIEAVGQREVPGRPALFATTKRFLDDLNLRSLEELPPLNELQATLEMTTADDSSISVSTPDAALADREESSRVGTSIVDVDPTEDLVKTPSDDETAGDEKIQTVAAMNGPVPSPMAPSIDADAAADLVKVPSDEETQPHSPTAK